MEDLTILYYTSSDENESFEKKTIFSLVENCGDLPIISISQKPLKLGENICVGDVGASGFNMFRQVLIGCKAAKTKYVISAEADCLYPPEYFKFLPSRDDICYRNSNLYIVAHKRPLFWLKKEGATLCQVINREFYIERLEKLFEGAPEWSVEEKNFPKERKLGEDIFSKEQIHHYQTKDPIVSFKTSDSMRHYTNTDRIDRSTIPYWGDAQELRQKFL